MTTEAELHELAQATPQERIGVAEWAYELAYGRCWKAAKLSGHILRLIDDEELTALQSAQANYHDVVKGEVEGSNIISTPGNPISDLPPLTEEAIDLEVRMSRLAPQRDELLTKAEPWVYFSDPDGNNRMLPLKAIDWQPTEASSPSAWENFDKPRFFADLKISPVEAAKHGYAAEELMEGFRSIAELVRAYPESYISAVLMAAEHTELRLRGQNGKQMRIRVAEDGRIKSLRIVVASPDQPGIDDAIGIGFPRRNHEYLGPHRPGRRIILEKTRLARDTQRRVGIKTYPKNLLRMDNTAEGRSFRSFIEGFNEILSAPVSGEILRSLPSA